MKTINKIQKNIKRKNNKKYEKKIKINQRRYTYIDHLLSGLQVQLFYLFEKSMYGSIHIWTQHMCNIKSKMVYIYFQTQLCNDKETLFSTKIVNDKL